VNKNPESTSCETMLSKKSLGKKLFHSAFHFYAEYASWDLTKEEKRVNLRYLSIIMRIANASSLTELEEHRALHSLHDLKDGVQDATVKRKEIGSKLSSIRENLIEKNTRSKIVSHLMELEYSSREYLSTDEESIYLQTAINEMISHIGTIPEINAKAISREVAVLPSKGASHQQVVEKLEKIKKTWFSRRNSEGEDK